jgi:phosphoribosylformimino-5-aminoimidazole carboxamide ribotide isomerase
VIIVPAVDLRDGRCVRLVQGRADAETTFSDDPVAMARRWADLGAPRLHVVDLDGAFTGSPRQIPLITKIAAAVAPVPVEAGGGLRDEAAVETVLSAGAMWAVVGTRAALDPVFLRDLCRAFPERIIVAVDARGDMGMSRGDMGMSRGGRVAIKGWVETAEESVIAVGARARDAGAAALLYTDVSRDGTGLGPNVEDTTALAAAVDLPVLASGGVGSVADLLRLATIPGVTGAIVGRALYTGAIDLPAALTAVRGEPQASRARRILK